MIIIASLALGFYFHIQGSGKKEEVRKKITKKYLQKPIK